MIVSEGFDRDAAEAKAYDFVISHPSYAGDGVASRVAWHSVVRLLEHYGVSEGDRDWVCGLLVAAESEAKHVGFSRGWDAGREVWS